MCIKKTKVAQNKRFLFSLFYLWAIYFLVIIKQLIKISKFIHS